MSSELQNIPPVWTATAHWMAYMLYVLLLPSQKKDRKFWLLSALFLAVQTAFRQLTVDMNGLVFNLAVGVFALWTFLPFACLSHTWWTNRVYYCIRAFILGGFTASLAWQLDVFLAPGWSVLNHPLGESVFMLALYALVILVMFFLERGHRKEIQEMPVSSFSCISVSLIAFIIYVLSSLSFSSLETPFGGSTDAEAFNIRTMVYLGGVAILYAYHLQLCDSYTRLEVDALQNMLNMQYANYRLSQESIDLVNRKYHDLKHQIAVLRAEIGTEQKLEYLDQMEKEISTYEAQNKTGNKVLDTILTSKSLLCQDQDIRLTCVADGAALDFMDVMDLSTLFGNALDNAMESVSKLPDPEQRLIHLSVARQKGFLRIRVENRCGENLVVQKALPKTTKADRRFHGYGLKSICHTAEKYGGSATVHAENGWFELRILIPLNRETASKQKS